MRDSTLSEPRFTATRNAGCGAAVERLKVVIEDNKSGNTANSNSRFDSAAWRLSGRLSGIASNLRIIGGTQYVVVDCGWCERVVNLFGLAGQLYDLRIKK
jgi:hypothetical protein